MRLTKTGAIAVPPAAKLEGDLAMPGDKSISHRLAMLGSIADGTTTIQNFSSSADCRATLTCLERAGVSFREDHTTVSIQGRGLGGLREPDGELDAQNSGTTVRLLSGILAGCPLTATFIGDPSLSRRPMKRIIAPLRQFGAGVTAKDDNFLPLTVQGGTLHAIDYELPFASAQVKSAILLAGLHATGRTRLVEPGPSRNHTEIALRRFGVEVDSSANVLEIEGGQRLQAQPFSVPGDVSAAAFFVAAALGVRSTRIRIRNVGLNPTRTGFLNLLEDMGGFIRIENLSDSAGEPVGDLTVANSELRGGEIRGRWIGNVIDEIPVLAVLGTRMRNGIRIRDAAELRVKESDRILALSSNLRALGVDVEEFDDGFYVRGGQAIRGGEVDSYGDHRIAMAFAVAALFATDTVSIRNAACVAVSFPDFFDLLESCCSGGL
jgi:3-phosphoshikimate 1-carboxyvinyltransferase